MPHFSRLFTMFVLLLVLVPVVAVQASLRDTTNRMTMQGVVYGVQTGASGAAVVSVRHDGDTLEGLMNISAFPSAGRALCGAGPFVASRATIPFTLSFISQDTDPGCGFDHAAVYSGTATLDHDETRLWGELAITNAGSSTLAPDRVRYEVWAPDAEPPLLTYQGTFRNQTRGSEGTLTLKLREGTQLVAGELDFDALPGGASVCGGGSFAAPVAGELALIVTGRDPDAECGSEATIEVLATLAPNRDVVTGAFLVDGEEGTFSLERGVRAAVPAPVEASAAPAEQSWWSASGAASSPNAMIILALFVVCAMAVLVLSVQVFDTPLRQGRRRRSRGLREPGARSSATPRYAAVSRLLGDDERACYHALRQATPRQFVIFPHIRLATLIRASRWNPFERYRLQAECVDFVVCELGSTAPRLVVRLDAAAGEQSGHDAFVEAALAEAGIAVLHVPLQERYDPAELAPLVHELLGLVYERSLPVPPLRELPRLRLPAISPKPAPAPQPATRPELRWACGQCHREVSGTDKRCPHCNAVLELV
jgi:hypothetical protein